MASKQYKNYKSIINFGSNYNNVNTSNVNSVENPLTYSIPTVDSYFTHGPQSWKRDFRSKESQAYMSDYCATQWDGFCELASAYPQTNIVNNIDINKSINNNDLTAGDILIRNTAAKKYLVDMAFCEMKIQQFDATVASSPNIYYWQKNYGIDNPYQSECRPTYAVLAAGIDNDPVMNKVLAKPLVAVDILANIYDTMKKNGTLVQLKGTKLGAYYRRIYNADL